MKKLGVPVDRKKARAARSTEREGASEGDAAGGRGEARLQRASGTHCKEFEFYPHVMGDS